MAQFGRFGTLLLVALALLALPLTSLAQGGEAPLQVWYVDRDITDAIEYRDEQGRLVAWYTLNPESPPALALYLAGPYVLAWRSEQIAFFDPTRGVLTHYPLPHRPEDSADYGYSTSDPVPMPDGSGYVYALTRHPNSGQARALSQIIAMPVPPQGERTVLYEQEMAEPYLVLVPLGFSADGNRLVFAERPIGLGGYILFWQWSDVRVLDLASGAITLVDGDSDGFCADARQFAAVRWGDEIPSLHAFGPDSPERSAFPLAASLWDETMMIGGGAVFSPDASRVAYQLAREDWDNEKFWTVVLDLATGEQRVVFEEEAMYPGSMRFQYLAGWLDDTTLVVGSVPHAMSSVIDAVTGALLRQDEGVFLGYAGGLNSVAELAPGGMMREACAGAPTSRLRLGDTGRVTFTDGTPVNVRDAPGGARIASQPEGAGFTVMGGPYCAGDYAWWWLEFDDMMTAGYVAEGDGSSYFLEPWP